MARSLQCNGDNDPVKKCSGAALANGYALSSGRDLKGPAAVWKHFTSRGHSGPVACVRANSNASLVVTGGVDFSMRVWANSHVHEAYDCVAILNVEVPAALKAEEPGMCSSLCELIGMGDSVEWESEPKQGVTCVHPVCDVDGIKKTFRNGPTLCGTGHGSLHIMDLTREEGGNDAVVNLDKLHKGQAVNDICVLKVNEHGAEVEFVLMTAGEDGTAQMLSLRTKAVPRPEFLPLEQLDDNVMRDALFYGGGGRRAQHEAIKSHKDVQEETWLQYVDVQHTRSIPHTNPVLECHALWPYPNDTHLISFVTLSPSGLHLLNTHGDEQIFLRASMKKAKRYNEDTFEERGYEEWSTECKEHLSLATVFHYKTVKVHDEKTGEKTDADKTQALLVLGGREDTNKPEEAAKGRVAVWCIQNGVVAINNEHGEGIHFDVDQQKSMAERRAKEMDATEASNRELTKAEASTDIEPLCVYERMGDSLDLDQSGISPSFAVELRADKTTVDMWGLEACDEMKLVLPPEGPQNLLLCPGTEETELQMSHDAPVYSLQVIDTGEESALLTGNQDGCINAWDLGGADRGQIYAEMRSLSFMELAYPPIEVVITSLQLLAFAFGPPPDEVGNQTKSNIKWHHLVLGRFSFGYSQEELFWPEVKMCSGVMAVFLLVAVCGLDEVMDNCVAAAYDMQKDEQSKSCFSVGHILVKLATAARGGTYLFVQLVSTVLVVPMFSVVARTFHCVEWTNEDGETMRVVNSSPHMQCFVGDHLQAVFIFVLLVPLFLFLLVPFAVVAGDALYVPHETMFDYKFWNPKNSWRKAAARKATRLHQSFLHLNPSYAFLTLLVDLLGKILMPTFAILSKSEPELQMILITTTNFVTWLSTMAYAPYVDRIFTVLVQDMKLMIFTSSATGCISVALQDADSPAPRIALVVLTSLVFLLLFIQLCLTHSNKPEMRLHNTKGAGSKAATTEKEEAQPLLNAEAGNNSAEESPSSAKAAE